MQRSLISSWSVARASTRCLSIASPRCRPHQDHYHLRDTGAEQRNRLEARGTILRPGGSPSFEVVLEKAEKLEKLDLCKKYELQPRDVGFFCFSKLRD